MIRKLVLASKSPRRCELLGNAGFDLTVVPADVDESPMAGESAVDLAVRLAALKAEAVGASHPADIVLGADTTVVLDGCILGKPIDLDDARRMLRMLSGRRHQVVTGVALVRRRPRFRQVWHATTEVEFKQLSSAEIDDYISLVHVLDKAGAYAIQEHGDLVVRRICGLRSNVVGLPVEDVEERLRMV